MYEEKYVRRGEIYSVRYDNVLPGETAGTRPGLIISNNTGNSSSPAVIIVYLTTQDHNIGIHYGPTKATGRPSYIQCEQIYTVSKQRLGRLLGSLSESEMREVESRLDEVLDLGWVDDASLKEKEQAINALKLQMEELKNEVSILKTSLSAKEDEIITRDVEIAVHKRMYEKAIGIIAAMKAEPDLPDSPYRYSKIPKKEETPELPKKPEPPKPPEPPKKDEEPNLPDINTATFSQLRGAGFSNSQTLSVINSRPYGKLEDMKDVPGVGGKAYYILSKRVCCIPLPVEEKPKKIVVLDESVKEKVNINTATVEDLIKVGFGKVTAQHIVSYRNNHGNYEKVDDLRKISRVGEGSMRKLGHLLEV